MQVNNKICFNEKNIWILNDADNPCFSFFLGITAVPREIETMLMRKFVGQIRCVMGDVEVANAQHTEYTMKSF